MNNIKLNTKEQEFLEGVLSWFLNQAPDCGTQDEPTEIYKNWLESDEKKFVQELSLFELSSLINHIRAAR